jgi:hypothetical protein
LCLCLQERDFSKLQNLHWFYLTPSEGYRKRIQLTLSTFKNALFFVHESPMLSKALHGKNVDKKQSIPDGKIKSFEVFIEV